MTAKTLPRLTLTEIANVLIKHYDLHEGLWAVAFDIKIGVGQFGPKAGEVFPGAMFGISNVYLTSAEKEGQSVLDAAKVNPIPECVLPEKLKPSKKIK